MILSRIRQENIYLAIQALQQENGFCVKLLCQIAGIARSSYYKWSKRQPSTVELENRQIVSAMITLYEKVDGIYGHRRLTINFRREMSRSINHKRVHRLMKSLGIKSVIRRKKKQYVKSTPQHIAENLLNRVFTADKSNKKWKFEPRLPKPFYFLLCLFDRVQFKLR